MEAKEERYRIYHHEDQGSYCLLDETRKGVHWQQEVCETLTAEDADTILAALTAQADASEWRDRLTDWAVVNWTLTEANADNPKQLIADTVAQLQRWWDDPAISEVAAKAQADAAALKTAVEALEQVLYKAGNNTVALHNNDPNGFAGIFDVARQALDRIHRAQ